MTNSKMSEGHPELAYDVAVAVMPVGGEESGGQMSPQESSGSLPGYDDALGRPWGRARPTVLHRGEEAVETATEALAKQIAATARRMAAILEEQQLVTPSRETLGLESVQITFGVTFSAGVQTLFTAQAGSSAQVAITLSRHNGGSSS
jgi:hypothetical protein